MRLNSIDIIDFKNIPETTLSFSRGVNCLLGRNGMGKSNLLEAIHLLCLARPFSSVPESALIRHGREMSVVKGAFTDDNLTGSDVACGLVKGKPKTLKINGKAYKRFSEHLGKYPVVTVAPADSRLVSESGEERRRLLDMVISQGRPDYLAHLIRFGKALESRNKMLRAGIRDKLLFESVESGIVQAGEALTRIRAEWVEEMAPRIADVYTRISGGQDTASVAYKGSVEQGKYAAALDASRDKDSILGYTTRGPHRDDIEMLLDGYSMRRLGSQGQIKTFTIALRMAIFSYLHQTRNEMPLLMLDDIFDKLDASRVGRIMEMVTDSSRFGQIFITDTNRKHLDEILTHIEADCTLIEVDNGRFNPIITPTA